MSVSVLSSGLPTGMEQQQQQINIAIFSDTMNVINVKLGMVILHIKFCVFIPFSVTWTVIQGHSSVKQL